MKKINNNNMMNNIMMLPKKFKKDTEKNKMFIKENNNFNKNSKTYIKKLQFIINTDLAFGFSKILNKTNIKFK